MCQSLIDTVQRMLWRCFRHIVLFQSLIGTVQLVQQCCQKEQKIVSIPHRYGSTTVFTAFSVFIIPHFPCFSTFFSKKVGQPLHSKFPQSLDFTGFFIFVKNSSKVHRLFYRIFNNLLFECPTLNFYRKPKISMQSIAAFISSV